MIYTLISICFIVAGIFGNHEFNQSILLYICGAIFGIAGGLDSISYQISKIVNNNENDKNDE